MIRKLLSRVIVAGTAEIPRIIETTAKEMTRPVGGGEAGCEMYPYCGGAY
jgi:hypothetical protein